MTQHAESVRARRKAARVPYRRAMSLIDDAIIAIWDAEQMPMGLAEDARILLCDAKRLLDIRAEEMARRER